MSLLTSTSASTSASMSMSMPTSTSTSTPTSVLTSMSMSLAMSTTTGDDPCQQPPYITADPNRIQSFPPRSIFGAPERHFFKSCLEHGACWASAVSVTRAPLPGALHAMSVLPRSRG
eukprot:15485309-Alexandrium_andersonii.AAC.1